VSATWIAVVTLLLILSPVVGVMTLLVALLLSGQSLESDSSGSALAYFALGIPAAWGALGYRLTRRAGNGRGAAWLALAVLGGLGLVSGPVVLSLT
jgi:hypothetical protein